MSDKLDDFIFNLKFQSKQLHRDAQKQLKEAEKIKAKAKKEIQRGYRDAAEIYAQQAITHLNFNAKYVKMACRMDIIAGQLKSQQVNNQVTKEIGRLNNVVAKCVNSDALVENAKVLTHFNNVCDMLGVQQATVENMMGATDNVQDVNSFLSQLEAEIAADQAQKISNVPEVKTESNEDVEAQPKSELNDMKNRLAQM